MGEAKTKKVYRQISNLEKGIVIILARGGSKGVKRKNIRLLNGFPMIYYTIKAAMDCDYIKACYVSTEDEEIKVISKGYGAKIIDRPKELAGDFSTSRDAIKHAIEHLEKNGEMTDWFVHMQPTSPLRTSLHLTESIELFLESDMTNVVSMKELDHHPFKCFIRESEKFLPVSNYEDLEKPRQLLPPAFATNGAIYIIKKEEFIINKSLISKNVIPYIMDTETSIDIDSESDLKYIDYLFKEME